MRYCFVCKKAQEFRPIPTFLTSITLNWNKALQYCPECKTVVFVEASEEVEKEGEEFYGKLALAIGAY